MLPLDPQIQRLISRHLDGRLPPRQQAELYRHLLKNPQVRQTMEDFQANDRLAAEALAGLWPAGQPPVVPVALITSELPRRARPFSVSRLLAGVAAAAAIGLLVGTMWFTLPTGAQAPAPPDPRLAVTGAEPTVTAERAAALAAVDLDTAAENAVAVPVANGGEDGGFVGLVDERENRVYLLKVEQPPRMAAGQFGDF